MSNAIYIVDVFAESKFEGNQLAVVIDKLKLSTNIMQKIAREINFSETTFVTGFDLSKKIFNVRIFTPYEELPFAGHPTLGTAFICQRELIKSQVDSLTLDLKAGMIPVTFDRKENETILWMKQLNPQFGDLYGAKDFSDILNLDPSDFDVKFPIQEVSTGVWFYIIPLKTRKAIKRMKLNVDKLNSLSAKHQAKWPLVFCPEPESSSNHLKARMVNSWTEDPATGSANGCLAGYLVKHRYFASTNIDIRIEQGSEVGRPSLLYLKAEDKGASIDVRVGGKVMLVAKGELL